MLLTATDLRLLVEAALVTRSGELGCDTCLDHVAAYAELRLTGIAIPKALRLVEEHLELCSECHEEFSALAATLKGHATR